MFRTTSPFPDRYNRKRKPGSCLDNPHRDGNRAFSFNKTWSVELLGKVFDLAA